MPVHRALNGRLDGVLDRDLAQLAGVDVVDEPAHDLAVRARAIVAELRDEWARAMAPGALDTLEQLPRGLRATLWPARSGPGPTTS